ncbi:MAG: sensor histidine kinase [Tepidiformaceae bacterium]
MGDHHTGHDDEEYYRREAMGAFAHEVRTPLTSIRMVMELGRRQAAVGEIALDRELSQMLATSVDDLQRLADELQETSRLERGKLALGRGPCDLAAAIGAAEDLTRPQIVVEHEIKPGIAGPWDAARLVGALAGFVESANRMGDGSGVVCLTAAAGEGTLVLRFGSGKEGRERVPVAADAGFGFFRARLFVLAMGGTVKCFRSQRHATISVTVPYAAQGSAVTC